jgi:hypothetical protein
MDRSQERQLANPNPGHRLQIGNHVKIDLETRVLGAQIDTHPFVNQPPAALRLWLIGEFELNGDPALSKCRRIDAPPERPH